ncbi:MAG: hypothetical protein IJM42_03195 [Synergistes sp.]|nr:hypothetical protein [Synergistes sp.]MCR5336797.1 hypothetical protein [Synergistes sp.]
MIFLSLIWLLQDLVQLILMGICMIPDVFLLTILFLALLPWKTRDDQSKLIWAAFIGGLLWDLRWTNLPGFTSAVGCGLVGAACIMWQKLPAIGRTPVAFMFISAACQLLYALTHCFFWAMPSQSALRQFIVQQLIAVPVIIIFTLLYGRVSERDG